MHFTKMQGAGNDYVYVNGFKERVRDAQRLAAAVSDRHFGIGSDGLIILVPSDIADFSMKMYNADGSEGLMCGNGLRCSAAFAARCKIVDKPHITVETKAGIRDVYFKGEDVLADMSCPFFLTGGMPDISHIEGAYHCAKVDAGNPHFVVFVRKLKEDMAKKHGRALECAPQFPDRSNIEFVQVTDRNNMIMSVWERGSHVTLSCGSGTCAAFFAARSLGLVDDEVNVKNPGGLLCVRYLDGHCMLSGNMKFVFDGIWEDADE